MFDQNYQAPRAIRSNLNWSGAVLDNRFRLNAEVTYSLNENQPGDYDLNFNPGRRRSRWRTKRTGRCSRRRRTS